MDKSLKSSDLIAGGLSGAVATTVTYPLEVLKTRLQSSSFAIRSVPNKSSQQLLRPSTKFGLLNGQISPIRHASLYSCTRQMVQNEGYVLFFRGFLANVTAVSLSKAFYFPVYTKCKRFLGNGNDKSRNAIVHSFSAASAGFVSATLTNPVWFWKTRLQLDISVGNQKLAKKIPIAVQIYKKEGIQVFFSGLTASYLGIGETVIQFVLYEFICSVQRDRRKSGSEEQTVNVSSCMIAASISKTIATVAAYPHEVFRTRSREHQNVGKPILQLFKEILSNEGWQALYRGLGPHLIRQVPNSAVLFLTYESITQCANR
ncbi:mitochondrial carrier protein Rim2-like [Xenia sp. Carnegie-2017]|uniref:mitochondrial carrier protein Rim2-like n=1 Tax=Xenia sp. Carnegie-2017 TaxID=2897299 RepID=UPI001F034BFB|nr:mitochondrial carrier protein Rim2-like [Xenia sp. Carnegie-2017]